MTAIRLQQVDVTYRRYTRPRDALLEWVLRKPRHQVFHALQNVSFELEQGASLGIVGDNGAGKSTLLRLLAGNLAASRGQAEVHGRRSALLELGSGLHPEFTGVENARLGLALRGLDEQAIAESLPAVLGFAELGEFAAQPVKTYSSGMVVRLVFAVAAVIDPEVLIVDEALSVGDQYFQKKSMDRMRTTLDKGATLVFCSHNLYQVREMCEQALWLEQGKVKMLGEAQAVVDAYQNAVRARSVQVSPLVNEPASGIVGGSPQSPHLLAVNLHGNQLMTGGLPCFSTGQAFTVEVGLNSGGQPADDIHVGIVLRRNDDVQCYGISTLHDKVQLQVDDKDYAQVRFMIERLPLLAGEYCLEVWLVDSSGVHVYDSRERCCYFRVQQASQAQGVGMVCIAHQWEGTEKLPLSPVVATMVTVPAKKRESMNAF